MDDIEAIRTYLVDRQADERTAAFPIPCSRYERDVVALLGEVDRLRAAITEHRQHANALGTGLAIMDYRLWATVDDGGQKPNVGGSEQRSMGVGEVGAELDALEEELDRAEGRLDRVYHLHAEGEGGACRHCRSAYPCATIQALEADRERP